MRKGTALLVSMLSQLQSTSHAPRWSEGEEWKVDPQPSTQIGLGDVEPEQFLRIRRVRVRSDRSVAVLDGSSSEVRVFDSSGALLMILAGEGDGPGELRGPRELYVISGDTMLVWDNRPSLSRFDRDGRFLDRKPVAVTRVREYMPDRMTIGIRGLQDGSVLAVGYAPPINALGRVRNRMLYARASVDGVRLDTLGPSLDREWWVPASGRGRGRTILGPESHWAVGGRPLQIALAEGATPEVRRYTADGILEQVVDFPPLDRSVPEGAIKAAKDARREVPMPSANLERFLADAPDPVLVPAMGGLILDGDGYLWVLPYRPDEGAASWQRRPIAHVFDANGQLLGGVELPLGLFVHDVGNDWVAGVTETELGVEVVQMHRLRRATGQGTS